ncbi:MAG: protein kinase [Phycisphaerales bacterium]|nr:protein kinase [Phycisphaerales bacterium]
MAGQDEQPTRESAAGEGSERPRGTTSEFLEKLVEEVERDSAVSEGDVIGEYRVLEKIGSGGNGEVWRVVHPRTGKDLALKLIKEAVPTEAARREFELEWRTLSKLNHPNIAKLYDRGWRERNGRQEPFYVMEVLRRKNGKRALGLRDYCREHKLGIEARVGMMVRVCSAVQHAHEQGAYHRDLKPGNIPVDEMDGAARPGLGVPKVIDFGLAKVLGAGIIDDRSEVKPGDTRRTLRYAAPEQVRGDAADIQRWTDVHALGLIAFELIADRLPYNIDNVPDGVLNERVQHARRARLTEVAAGVDEELAEVLARATAARISERTQSARELEEGLERWLEKRRVKSVVWGGVTAALGRKKWMCVVGAAAVAAVAAEVGVSRLVAWRNWDAPFERWLSRMNPSWADVPLDDVVVVTVDEGMNTQTAVDALCAATGLEGVSVEKIGSLRPLLMRVTGRIAEGGQDWRPRAVGLDILLEKATSFDSAAARELRKIVESEGGAGGADVVLAMPKTRYVMVDGRRAPEGMCADLARCGPRGGIVTGVFRSEEFWSIDLVVQRLGEGAAASLPAELIARAEGLSPGAQFVLGGAEDGSTIVDDPSGAHPNGQTRTFERMTLETVSNGDVKSDRRWGFAAGDRVRKMLLALPGERARAASTVSFATVAGYADGSERGDKELSNLFNGKIVIVGDVRWNRPDLATPEVEATEQVFDLSAHPRDGRVAGVYALATATQWLLDGRYIKQPGGWWPQGMVAAMTGIGAGLALWARTRKRRKAVWLAAGVLVVGGMWMAGLLGAYSAGAWYIEPWIPLSGMVMGAVGVWLTMGLGRGPGLSSGMRAGG